MKIESNIRVEVWNIVVDKRYYSFRYRITMNNRLAKQGEYENDHSWSDDVKGFERLLKEDGAVSLALEQWV
jgi:hypothetical protein